MVSAISSNNAAAGLASLQAPAPVARRDRDGDNDAGRETSESSSAQPSEQRAPLPATGSVGRSVDISA